MCTIYHAASLHTVFDIWLVALGGCLHVHDALMSTRCTPAIRLTVHSAWSASPPLERASGFQLAAGGWPDDGVYRVEHHQGCNQRLAQRQHHVASHRRGRQDSRLSESVLHSHERCGGWQIFRSEAAFASALVSCKAHQAILSFVTSPMLQHCLAEALLLAVATA